MNKIALISLGCAKNRVDSEHLLGGLAAWGFSVVEDPTQADAIIITTCGFIRDAAEESIEEILAAAEFKKSGKCRCLIVAGCLVKRYPDIANEIPEADLFFTQEEFGDIPGELARTWGVAAKPQSIAGAAPRRFLTQQNFSAYLKIADGCSNRCSFCTIPTIRGSFRTIPEPNLVEEARQLADAGVVELNLVAQDSTSYGQLGSEPRALANLLAKLENIDGLKWLRLLYAYPRRFPPGVVEMLAAGGKTLPYIDVPIQHIHPRILSDMGRKTSAAEVEDLLLELQSKIYGLVLRTTVIVGFPGETEKEFQTLLDFMEKIKFNHLGAFLYSPEEGTPAEKLKSRIPKKEAKARLDSLMSLQADISAERNQEYLGKEIEVLIEGIEEDGVLRGRCRGQAPEVDGCVYVKGLAHGAKPGTFIRAKIVETWEYDLSAEAINR